MIEITDEMVEMYLSALYPSWRYFDDGLKAHRRSNAAGDLRAAITAVAPLIAAAEREECARIVERHPSEIAPSTAAALAGSDYMLGLADTSEYLAAAIRARGDKP